MHRDNMIISGEKPKEYTKTLLEIKFNIKYWNSWKLKLKNNTIYNSIKCTIMGLFNSKEKNSRPMHLKLTKYCQGKGKMT